MRIIQAEVSPSTTEPISFANSNIDQDGTRETMAVVQRVVEDAGTDTKTFCRWLMSSKVEVGGPLSGICHWFTHPEKPLYRTRGHVSTHGQVTRLDHDAMETVHRTGVMSHIHESTSISIIMILATVLFILLITAFVTCIIRKKRQPQTSVESHMISSVPVSSIMVRKDKPPDYNSVIRQKEMEENELPSYNQAISQTDSHTESQTDSDSDILPPGDCEIFVDRCHDSEKTGNEIHKCEDLSKNSSLSS